MYTVIRPQEQFTELKRKGLYELLKEKEMLVAVTQTKDGLFALVPQYEPVVDTAHSELIANHKQLPKKGIKHGYYYSLQFDKFKCHLFAVELKEDSVTGDNCLASGNVMSTALESFDVHLLVCVNIGLYQVELLEVFYTNNVSKDHVSFTKAFDTTQCHQGGLR